MSLQFAGKGLDGAIGEPPAADELCAASERSRNWNEIAERRAGFAAVDLRQHGEMIPVDRKNVGVSRIALSHPGAEAPEHAAGGVDVFRPGAAGDMRRRFRKRRRNQQAVRIRLRGDGRNFSA